MTATAHTAFALPKAGLAIAVLLAGLATSSAQAAVAKQDAVATGTTLVASYSYPVNGNGDIAGSHHPAATGAGALAARASAGLRLTADPSLLWVAALGVLCLSLSWRQPAARHADKLRQRLASDDTASQAQG